MYVVSSYISHVQSDEHATQPCDSNTEEHRQLQDWEAK